MTTFAIGVGVDQDELYVTETEDNFGAFVTKEAAAIRVIEMVDARMEALRSSKAKARRIVRSANKSK
ncbi:hypothetical protein [Brucella anthropi]|uniref:hypothetical protein n=1 Tax=Brucella anthropi TaxID=529 RepID=UPI002158504D|nr:hypothetical protein [Brucella anthropi]MCR8493675.1 hypothetical protein [Brucella anthropi]